MLSTESLAKANIRALYNRTQDVALRYDIESECGDGTTSSKTTDELEQAYDEYLVAVNAQRITIGEIPYQDINCLPSPWPGESTL